MEETKRSLQELIVRYRLESDIFDIYVEGKEDSYFYKCFLKCLGIKNFVVYEISTVRFNEGDLFKYRLSNSKKLKVVFLAKELEENLPRSSHKIICVVDADFDHFLNIKYAYDYLLSTDFTSIEMYLYDEMAVDKFFDIVIRKTNSVNSKIFLENLSVPLRQLFLVRVANELLQTGKTWPKLKNDMFEFSDGAVFLKMSDFLDRYLQNNALLKERFNKIIEEKRDSVLKDPRMGIHGKDFLDLLWIYINEKFNGGFSQELIERGLFACGDKQCLEFGLFTEIVNKCKS